MSLDNDGSVTPIRPQYVPSEEETNAPASKGVSFDTPVYEGIDVISNISNNLNVFSQKSVYEASAQSVSLPPPDPEGATGPQPYGIVEQRLIRKYYSDRTLELLKKKNLSEADAKKIYDALMSGKEISDARLRQIGQKVKEQVDDETRKESRLPDSWELNSNTRNDWIPRLPNPYDAAERSKIKAYYDQAVKDETIAGTKLTANEIAVKAAEKTQKAYSLSTDWTPETTEASFWVPQSEVVNQQSVSQEQSSMVISNLQDLTTDIESAMNKVVLSLPESSGRSQGDYLKTLAEAIRELKELLQQLQLQDAEITEKVSQLKFDQIETRIENLEKAKNERAEMEEKKRSQAGLAKFFKIFGPVISALSVIVGAALSLAGGVGIGIIIAGVAVGTAMTAYTIVDGETGMTQSLMSSLNSVLESWFPGDDNILARAGMKCLLIAAGVAFIALALVAGGGGIAANVTSQVAREAIKESVKQTAIQVAIITTMSSNVLPEVVSSSLIQSGAISKDDSNAKMIAQMIAMALTMIAVLSAVAYATRTQPPAPVAPVNEPALASASARLQEVMNRIVRSVKELPEDIVNSVKDFGKGAGQFGGDIKGTFIGGEKMKAGLSAFQTSLRLTGSAMQMYDSITRGILALELKRMLEALGNLELAEELTQALVRVLEQLLQNLQSDMASQGDWMVSLQETYNALLGQSKQNVSKLFQA